MPTSEDFRNALRACFARGEALGIAFVGIISGELHRVVGGYPGPAHRCCAAMCAEQRGGDQILHARRSETARLCASALGCHAEREANAGTYTRPI